MTNLERIAQSAEVLAELLIGDLGDFEQYEDVLCVRTEISFPIKWNTAKDSIIETLIDWLNQESEE